jgi:hypothetical protein
VKQTLYELAKRVCALRNATTDDDAQLAGIAGLPTIHHGLVMRPEFVEARLGVLDKLEDLIGSDGMWCRSTIDDIVLDFIQRVCNLQRDQSEAGVRTAVEEALTRFSEAPSSWVVDRLVYGFSQDCAGVRFGRLPLLGEDVSAFSRGHALFPRFPTGNQVFARLETSAIDQESAIQRANNILDEHLDDHQCAMRERDPFPGPSVTDRSHTPAILGCQDRAT